jgi:cob(I)alamin adenosyltransferase
MRYFSGKGDKGDSIIGKKRISKDSLILDSLGELDELNSLIGLAKNYLIKKYFHHLTEIQNDLFVIQANLAYFIYPKFKPPKFKRDRIELLEKNIAIIEEKIKSQESFIIYGSDKNSAWFDYLRSVVRRVERKIIRFYKRRKGTNFKEILSYLNRLSSYFYALARFVCYNKKIKEKKPWY